MQLPSDQTILFFSPHPDDEVLAAGALLTQLARDNKVIIYFVTNSPRGVVRDLSENEKIRIRQKEAINSCRVMRVSSKFLNLDNSLKVASELQGNLETLTGILYEKKPSMCMTLYEKDAHPTHQAVTKLVKQAAKSTNIPLCYGEVWTPILQPNDAFFFNDDVMQIKLEAIAEYKSQLERTDYATAIKDLNSYRAITLKEILGGFGSTSRSKGKYAEAFMVKK